MSSLITSKEIERWRPESFGQVVGCGSAKTLVANAVNCDGDIPNIMITGDPGTGKTCLVRLASSAALCTASSNRPCGVCEKCQGIDTRFSDCGLFVAFDEIVRNYHVIDCCNTSSEDLTNTILQLREVGSHVVVLDEAHGLRRRQMDSSLLDPIEKYSNTTWIASTAYPQKLDPMLRRRFSIRVQTEKPTVEECTAFVIERCEAWSISTDAGEADLLSCKSMQNISEVIGVLAVAASLPNRRLSFELIKGFPFLDFSSCECR